MQFRNCVLMLPEPEYAQLASMAARNKAFMFELHGEPAVAAAALDRHQRSGHCRLLVMFVCVSCALLMVGMPRRRSWHTHIAETCMSFMRFTPGNM